MLRRVTFVLGHGTARVSVGGIEERVPLADALGVAAFAAAVRRHTAAEVLAVHGNVVPTDIVGTAIVGDHLVIGWLLAEADPHATLSRHLVRLHASRTDAMELITDSGFAAAIDTSSYLTWRADPDDPASARLYGRVDVARAIGARTSQQRDGACIVDAQDRGGLASLVAAYLEADEGLG